MDDWERLPEMDVIFARASEARGRLERSGCQRRSPGVRVQNRLLRAPQRKSGALVLQKTPSRAAACAVNLAALARAAALPLRGAQTL